MYICDNIVFPGILVYKRIQGIFTFDLQHYLYILIKHFFRLMNNAYFNHIQNEIKLVLRKAETSIQVAMAWFTNEVLLDELISCLQRNVEVSMVLLDDPINWMPYAPDFNQFIAAGGHLYIADASIGFMHHKFCIIDGHFLITGSYNWTHYAESRNLENIVISDDGSLCQHYNDEFKKLVRTLSMVSKTSKIEWQDLGDYTNVNFDEINYEIAEISQHRNLKRVKISPNVEEITRPVLVQVIEAKKVFRSNKVIGIWVDENEWQSFIEKGELLPFSRNFEMYLDNRNPEQSVFNLCQYDGIETHPMERCLIHQSLGSIAYASKSSSKINIEISLDINGYLNIRIVNQDNGKLLDVSDVNRNLVYIENK